MEILTKASRVSFGIMVIGLAVQQIFYVDFRPVVAPPLPILVPGHALLVYLLSIFLIIASLAIIFDKRARTAALALGGVFLLLLLLCEIPYEIIVDPYSKHLGVWADAFKELAFCGGAFVVAGSFAVEETGERQDLLINFLAQLIPLGSVFFSMTMICFGIDHFLYADGISTLVPNWIPGHIFWTYFAGVALIGSGITITLRIKLKISALLLALMIFLWFILLHIPRAIVDPYTGKGNEVSSVFEALGFSGIAYLIAYGYRVKGIFKP